MSSNGHTNMDGVVPVTAVKVDLPYNNSGKLLAFVTVELGGAMVVKDVEVYESPEGRTRVGMPSRPRRVPCILPRCGAKVRLFDRFCPMCGTPQLVGEVNGLAEGSLYRELVHPCNNSMRRYLHGVVLDAFGKAVDDRKAFESQGVNVTKDEEILT